MGCKLGACDFGPERLEPGTLTLLSRAQLPEDKLEGAPERPHSLIKLHGHDHVAVTAPTPHNAGFVRLGQGEDNCFNVEVF